MIDDVRYVYMLFVEELDNNEVIVKIGRTNNFDRRKSEYNENFKTISVIPVDDEKSVERYLLKEFRNSFVSRMDYGYEYFQGYLIDLFNLFITSIMCFDDEDSC